MFQIIDETIKSEGQKCLGWRDVPVDADKADVGPASRKAQPIIKQLFIEANSNLTQDEFDRKLYIIRKQISHLIRGDESFNEGSFSMYVASLPQ